MEKEIKIEIPNGYDDVIFDKVTKTLKYIKHENKKERVKVKSKSWKEYCTNHGLVKQVNFCDHFAHFDVHSPFELLFKLNDTEYRAFQSLMALYLVYKEWTGKWTCADSDSENLYVIDFVYDLNERDILVRKPIVKEVIMKECGLIFYFPEQDIADEFLRLFAVEFDDVKQLFR